MAAGKLVEPVKQSARDRILAAAMDVARESGAGRLSLEAIARRAGVSKGGLLYHFPKKDGLMRALVEHHLARVEAAMRDAEDAAGHGNAAASAFVEIYRDKIACEQGRPTGVLAALAENPGLLIPVREHKARIAERIRSTAADPDLSLIAFLVVEGLNALDLFEADPLTTAERERAVTTLLQRLEAG